jgi:excisionase family DNA binding protein
MAKRTYTTFEVGEICSVYPTTVINWVNQKKLPAFVTPGGHRRIRREDLVEFLKKYNFPTPVELLGSRRRILIVDDDVAFARMLMKAFERHNDQFDTQVIHNGIEALVALGKKPPDLVLLDVVMPIVDGSTVCATLRANPDTRHIRIIAMTGKRLPDETTKFIRSKSDGLYRKPFDPSSIVRRAAEVLKMELKEV